MKNKYPLLCIDDLFDHLNGAKLFSRIDLVTGIHQLRIAKDSVPVIVFRTQSGFYEWLVMPFELTNVSAYFVDLMNRVFRYQLNKFVLVFVDDILVYSRIEEDHKKNLRIVLDIQRRNKLKAKFSRCHFWRSDVCFLDHVVSEQGVVVNPTKVAIMQDWRRLEKAMDVRNFLGLACLYRRFINDFQMLQCR